MKKALKILCLSFGVACTLSPLSATAAVPVIDPSVLAEAVYGNLQAMRIWAQENRLIRQSMSLSGLNASLEVDALNNAMANLIVRQGKTAEEIQNLQVLQDSMPSPDACNAYSTSLNLEDILCDITGAQEVSVSNQIQKMNTLKLESAAEIEDHIQNTVSSVLAQCRELSGGDEDGSACLNTLALLGAYPTMTDEEAAATELQIGLIVEPVPRHHIDPRQSDEATERDRIFAMRELSLKTLASNSLMAVRAERVSVGGQPSRLQLLRNFTDEYFGSSAGADFLSIMTNSNSGKHDDISKQTTPAQVLRSIAVMDSFLVYMELLKYEQQLRMETLQAAMLSVAVEPLR